MKLLPMNPIPPVTRSLIASQQDLRAVPGYKPVAGRPPVVLPDGDVLSDQALHDPSGPRYGAPLHDDAVLHLRPLDGAAVVYRGVRADVRVPDRAVCAEDARPLDLGVLDDAPFADDRPPEDPGGPQNPLVL